MLHYCLRKASHRCNQRATDTEDNSRCAALHLNHILECLHYVTFLLTLLVHHWRRSYDSHGVVDLHFPVMLLSLRTSCLSYGEQVQWPERCAHMLKSNLLFPDCSIFNEVIGWACGWSARHGLRQTKKVHLGNNARGFLMTEQST